MKKLLWAIAAVIAIQCFGCKKEYKSTVAVNKYNNSNGCPVKLYREYYCTFSGYLTTDLNSVYLTDSTNFRMNLGQYDTGNEWIATECKGDSLYVKKMLRVEPYYKIDTTTNAKDTLSMPAIIYPPKILESKAYSIKALKKGWRFWE
nr:hypothetical protein [Mucilaginibacter sp. L294]